MAGVMCRGWLLHPRSQEPFSALRLWEQSLGLHNIAFFLCHLAVVQSPNQLFATSQTTAHQAPLFFLEVAQIHVH